jgi:hypothetical protein
LAGLATGLTTLATRTAALALTTLALTTLALTTLALALAALALSALPLPLAHTALALATLRFILALLHTLIALAALLASKTLLLTRPVRRLIGHLKWFLVFGFAGSPPSEGNLLAFDSFQSPQPAPPAELKLQNKPNGTANARSR